MRVIAGTLRSRRIKTPTWEGLRPTSDKLRETLFNIIGPGVRGARVLDGFAGTGALGIEALSRGAAMVAFVELDRRAQALIAENLAHCGIEEGYVIIRASFIRGVAMLRADPAFAPFEIILLDPPYDQQPDDVLAAAAGCVTPGGSVILEHALRQTVPDTVAGLARTRTVRSGSSALTFFTPVPEDF